MALLPKVVFTYHAIDRFIERFGHISRISLRNSLLDPETWLDYKADEENADNKGDGKKVKIRLNVDGQEVIAIAILKMEDGRRTMVVPTVHR